MGNDGLSCGFLQLLVMMICRWLNDCCQWRKAVAAIGLCLHKRDTSV